MDSRLTGKANDVLEIMMNADHALTASQIVAENSSLNINTVQSVLRQLTNKGYIEVAEIVYSGTVLCRSYHVTEKAKSVSLAKFADQFDRLTRLVSIPTIFAALVDSTGKDSDDLIVELENVLKMRKKALNEEEM